MKRIAFTLLDVNGNGDETVLDVIGNIDLPVDYEDDFTGMVQALGNFFNHRPSCATLDNGDELQKKHLFAQGLLTDAEMQLALAKDNLEAILVQHQQESGNKDWKWLGSNENERNWTMRLLFKPEFEIVRQAELRLLFAKGELAHAKIMTQWWRDLTRQPANSED